MISYAFNSFQSVSPGIVETEFAARMTDEETAKKLYSGLKVITKITKRKNI